MAYLRHAIVGAYAIAFAWTVLSVFLPALYPLDHWPIASAVSTLAGATAVHFATTAVCVVALGDDFYPARPRSFFIAADVALYIASLASVASFFEVPDSSAIPLVASYVGAVAFAAHAVGKYELAVGKTAI